MAKPMENLCSNLEQEFDSLTKSLVDIDSSIRKVTGMDPRFVNLFILKFFIFEILISFIIIVAHLSIMETSYLGIDLEA